MSQLFKDCSREALALRGTPGLITLWLATLPDLFKTAFEENFKEITHMSKEKFHRLGKLAFVLGIGLFYIFALVAESTYMDPMSWKIYFQFASAPISMLLLAVGAAALRSQYGQSTGRVASGALAIAAIAATTGAVGAVVFGMLNPDLAWIAFISGAEVMFVGIGVFGLSCIRKNILSGVNWLLMLGGFAVPLISMLEGIAQDVTNNQSAMVLPWWIIQLVTSLAMLSLLAAGLLLQGTQQTAPKPAKR